jgi:hypothetical protein
MQIEAVTPELAGDYNTNGVVDAADFVRWRDDPGGFGGDPAGYNIWRANFGRPPGAGSALDGAAQAAVPETATWTLVVIVGIASFSFSRRR